MPTTGTRGEPIWSDDELEQDRKRAIERFIAERLVEGSKPYTALFPGLEQVVRRLFDITGDLRNLDSAIFVNEPLLITPLRNLGGPPTSEDDLETLAEGGIKRSRPDAEAVARAIRVLSTLIDPYRCPWLLTDRDPMPEEREAAIISTVSLWCVQRVQTDRRMESSRKQQQEVLELLDWMGWQRVPARRIVSLEDLPRGSYASETIVKHDKADVPIRLKNGYLLAIECKVSNSPLNSIKRKNDVTNKAAAWRAEYGRQVITGAVIAGVFKLAHLQQAQTQGVVIFFDHRLDELRRFIEASS